MWFKLTLLAVSAAGLGLADNALSWVSSGGNDANACTRSAPCRTFAGAMTKTSDGGAIHAVDPANYGVVTVDRSITIEGVPGATIYAPAANDAITISGPIGTRAAIRNLTLYVTLQGQFLDPCAIRETAAAALLAVENVAIHMTIESVQGICAVGGRVHLRDVTMTGGAIGVRAENVLLSADRLATSAVGGGLLLINTNATIRDSVLHNSMANGAGLVVTATAGSASSVLVERTEFSQNVYGFMVNSTGGPYGPVTVRLDSSVITGNDHAYYLGSQASLISFRNNVIVGNTEDLTPALTSSLK